MNRKLLAKYLAAAAALMIAVGFQLTFFPALPWFVFIPVSSALYGVAGFALTTAMDSVVRCAFPAPHLQLAVPDQFLLEAENEVDEFLKEHAV